MTSDELKSTNRLDDVISIEPIDNISIENNQMLGGDNADVSLKEPEMNTAVVDKTRKKKFNIFLACFTGK